MLEVVGKLLQDKDSSQRGDLPTIVCALLRPYAKSNKLTKSMAEAISKIITSYGICSRCRLGKLKFSSDLFCKNCKSVLKETVKSKIV